MIDRLPARRAFSYPRPITFAWLVRHELVLSLGKFLAIPKTLSISLIIVVLLLASGFGALFATFVPLEPPASTAGMVYTLATVVLVFAVLISTIMPIMIERFFARTDQALIAGSIVDPLRWLYAQAIAVAIGASGIFYLILLPTAAIASIRGAYWTLSWPIAFTALVLMSCAISFAIGKLFVRWFGVARAKRFVQVAAILLCVVLYVGSQIYQMRAIASDDVWHFPPMVQTGIGFITDPWLGNWGAGLVALGASLLAVCLALKSLKNSVSDLLTGGTVSQTRSVRNQSRAFQASSVLQVAWQEIKICVRDPVTSAQAMSYAMYVTPMLFIGGGRRVYPAVTCGAIVLAAGLVASSFSWLAISGDRLTSLRAMGSAPLIRQFFGKLIAAASPALVFTLCVGASLVAWRGSVMLPPTLTASAYCMIAIVVAFTMQWAFRVPSPRNMLGRGTGNIFNQLLVAASVGMIAVAAGVAIGYGFWYSLILLIPALLYPTTVLLAIDFEKPWSPVAEDGEKF